MIVHQARCTENEPWQEVDEETFHHADTNGLFTRKLFTAEAVPNGWREFIELIATPCSEPLNSVCAYRDQASRKDSMARLREMAQNLLKE